MKVLCFFKRNGKYYLGAADNYEGRYSTCLAISDNIYGRIRSAMKEFLVGVARDILEIKKDIGGVAILVMTLNHISEKK